MTIFGQKYPFCNCELSLFSKVNNAYRPLSYNENIKVSDFNLDRFYLIKTKQCNCEYKQYSKYMNISKFDIITKLKKLEDKISVFEQNNEKLQKINEEYDSKIKDLLSKNLQLKEQLDKLQKEEVYKNINSKLEDYYDIIVDINSIQRLNKEGWEVKYNEKGFEKYKKYKIHNLITIGVLGNMNKGKSFILSKISKIELLTGIHTKGISVKYPELKEYNKRQIILLDSVGLEKSVLKKNNKEEKNEIICEKSIDEENEIKNDFNNSIKEEINIYQEFKENSRDKIITELFLESFIVYSSDILLVVVGELTYSEQLLINKIKVESQKQNKTRIFIIHNLKEFITIEQVESYIKETLLKCSTFNFILRHWISNEKNKEEYEIGNNDDKMSDNNLDDELVNRKLGNIHFTEILNYGDNKQLEVYHLIMANEDSDAGKYYNPYVYKFIENAYNLIPNPKKFDILESLTSHFINISQTILINPYFDGSFIKKQFIVGNKLIKLNFEDDLLLKTIFKDEFGLPVIKADNFVPKYNYFKPDPNTLEIRLEIPGNVKIDVNHKVVGDETIITVKGIKNKDKQPEKLNLNIFNIREFSEFELNIPLKVEEFQINQRGPKEGYPKFKNGICLIQYELAQEGAEERAEIISEEF